MQITWRGSSPKARSFSLKEHLNSRHYYLPEKKRRNAGHLETQDIGGVKYNIQDWHFIMRYILLFCWPILQPRSGLFTIKDSCSAQWNSI